MANDELVTRRGRLACVSLAGVLAIALIATFSASEAQAARVLPLPRVTAETYEIDFQDRPAVVLRTLLMRRVHGTVRLTCGSCPRFKGRKYLRSRPSRTSRRYRNLDWILRGGRAVKTKVTRRGWVGRYLLLTAQRRKGRLRLRYKASGCLSRRGMKIRCPRGVPRPRPNVIVQVVPVPPPTAVPARSLTAGVIYGIDQTGDLWWYRHGGRENGSLGWAKRRKVGGISWGSFKDVFSGDDGVIYAIRANGDLMWYRHAGVKDGSWTWLPARRVGIGWAGFSKVFSGGGGVIYGIQPNGHLIWRRHAGFRDGRPNWSGPMTVGTGWTGYSKVFSGGGGVIYGVQPNGHLIWHRHLGREDGSPNWSGPMTVGTGWTGFKEVFSGGGGVIYGVLPNGHLRWYRHLGRWDGSWNWSGPTTVGTGWTGFKRIVPAPA